MKLCQHHAELCDVTLQNHGLWALVENNHNFNPVIALREHISCFAMRLLSVPIQLIQCPLCEFERRRVDFNPELAIDELASDMARWAREQKIIPQLH